MIYNSVLYYISLEDTKITLFIQEWGQFNAF